VRAEYQRTSQTTSKQQTATAQPVAVDGFGAAKYAEEREALKAVAQYPHLVQGVASELSPEDFSHPVAQTIWAAVTAAGLPAAPDPGWLPRVSDGLDEGPLRSVLSVAAVEPLRSTENSTPLMVKLVMVRLQEQSLARRIADTRSRLDRTAADEDPEKSEAVLAELMELDARRRRLREELAGPVDAP
jgi:DNA primase